MAGSLHAEIFTSKGMGYETIESRESKTAKEIGYIEMDSIFSPVLLTGIKIENVRVGKMTNWEKIILNIKTDGTLSPEKAFEDSVKLLIEQFKVLLPGDSKEKKEDVSKEDLEVSEEKDEEKKEEVDEEEKEEKTKKRGRPKKS
jgi:DNA-directed RNA polymerase subunit alpha